MLAWQSRPEQVQALVAGWHSGLAAVKQDPDASAALLAPGADLTPAQYLAAFKGLDFYNAEQSLTWLSGQPKALGQASEGLAITLQTMGLIHESPNWGRLLAPEPAASLLQAQGARA